MKPKKEAKKELFIQLRDQQQQQLERAKKESNIELQRQAISEFTEPLGKLAKELREAGIDPATL